MQTKGDEMGTVGYSHTKCGYLIEDHEGVVVAHRYVNAEGKPCTSFYLAGTAAAAEVLLAVLNKAADKHVAEGQ